VTGPQIDGGLNRGPTEGRVIKNPVGGTIVFKASAAETSDSMTAFETVVPEGEGPPVHVHREQHEVLYIVEGTFRVLLGEDVQPAPEGAFVHIPRGLPHTWQNTGPATGRMLAIFVPGAPGMERFFEQFAAEDGEESAAVRFRRLGGPAGMDTLGPPLSQSHPL
jgi:quercetin dioxygenase-like cupin family protein